MTQTRQDMGSGSVKKLMLQLMIPAVVAQVVNLLYNIVDRIYIGHISGIGAAALTGVGLFTPILMLLNAFAMLVGAGGAPRTAIAMGQGDKQQAERIISNSFTVLMLFSVVLTVSFYAGAPVLLRLFGASDITLPYALGYSRIYILGSVFVLLVMGMNPFITAQGFAKISMLTTVIGAVINIILDPILIFGFGMGVMGAALASLVSRMVACFAVLYLLQKPQCPLRMEGLQALRPDGALIRRILRIGIPAGIENGMFQIGKLSVSSLTSTLGTAAIAANAVVNSTTTFLNVPANAVGMAALTVVGQCLGAGEKEQAVDYSRRLLFLAYCGAWALNLTAFFFVNQYAVSLFHLSAEAQTMALEVMRWFNIVSLFIWPSSFTLPNILRASGDSRFTMSVSILSMWVFRVGFCYLWVLQFNGGLLSIWVGMYLDWLFRSICFTARFVRGKWLEQNVI